MESLWTQVRGFFSRLDRIQKLALGVSAFGFLTSYLLAFTAGAFFGEIVPTRGREEAPWCNSYTSGIVSPWP